MNVNGYFAVEPKRDCPHVKEVSVSWSIGDCQNMLVSPCSDCGDVSENWVCLVCGYIACSRHVSSHMVDHTSNTGHRLVTSFSDLSTWCYGCDTYIVSPDVQELRDALYVAKFGELPPNVSITRVNDGDQDAPGVERTSYPEPTPIKHEEGPASSEDASQSGGLITSAKNLGRARDEDIVEYLDSPEVLQLKVKELADIVRASDHMVAYTGAGISTSAKIPDYRGPKGVWTMQDKGKSAKMDITLEQALPTPCHMGLAKLIEEGQLKYLVSTNVDGLHRRSGIPAENVSELHGNCYREVCDKCHTEYLRSFDVSSARHAGRANIHHTGRVCDLEMCDGNLCDDIVHFGESLPEETVMRAYSHSCTGDVALVLGTSMMVKPANQLPEQIQKNGGKLVICNLQRTGFDDKCALRIFARTDDVMEMLFAELGLEIPEYVESKVETTTTLSGNWREPKRVKAPDNASVEPRTDCPHQANLIVIPPEGFTVDAPCKGSDCSDPKQENWMCLECGDTYCGRVVNKHMIDHRDASGHVVAASFADLSFWCYSCDSYVISPELRAIYSELHLSKFGERPPQ